MNKKNNTKNTLFYRTQGRHRRIHKNTREVGETHNEAPKTKMHKSHNKTSDGFFNKIPQ